MCGVDGACPAIGTRHGYQGTVCPPVGVQSKVTLSELFDVIVHPGCASEDGDAIHDGGTPFPPVFITRPADVLFFNEDEVAHGLDAAGFCAGTRAAAARRAVSRKARRNGVGLVGGGKKPFSRSSCARAKSSMSWALSGTTSTTATSSAIASAPGPPRASLVQVFAGLATSTGRDWRWRAYVAQTGSLLPCRRRVAGQGVGDLFALETSTPSGLPTRDTADWQSALRVSAASARTRPHLALGFSCAKVPCRCAVLNAPKPRAVR